MLILRKFQAGMMTCIDHFLFMHWFKWNVKRRGKAQKRTWNGASLHRFLCNREVQRFRGSTVHGSEVHPSRFKRSKYRKNWTSNFEHQTSNVQQRMKIPTGSVGFPPLPCRSKLLLAKYRNRRLLLQGIVCKHLPIIGIKLRTLLAFVYILSCSPCQCHLTK